MPSWLNVLLKIIAEFLSHLNDARLKKAGKDEQRLDSLDEHKKRVDGANAIYDKHDERVRQEGRDE